jgi:hypothetical protein
MPAAAVPRRMPGTGWRVGKPDKPTGIFQVSSFKFQVSSFKFQVSSFKFQVSGCRKPTGH